MNTRKQAGPGSQNWLYQELVEYGVDLIWLLDLEGTFRFVSRSVTQQLGYTSESLIGRKILDFIHPEDQATVQEAIANNAGEPGRVASAEGRFRHLDGSWRMLAGTGRRLPEDADAVGIVVNLRDVTEREVAQEKIHHTSRLLRILRACNAVLVHEIDEVKLLTSICNLIVAEGKLISLDGTYPLAMVAFGRHGEGQGFEIVRIDGPAAGFAEGLDQAWAAARSEQGPIERAMHAGEPVVVRSIETESSCMPWAERAADYGLASMGVFPLTNDSQTIGVIVVFADKPQAFDHDEVSLLTELASDLAFGITTIRDRVRHAAGEERRLELERKTERALMQTIQAISRATEARDPYTAGHQREVARLADAIAREMGLSEAECTGIHIAGTLHDIGKLQVPIEILSRPTTLVEAEYTLIKSHAEHGYHILENIEFPWPVAEMVRQHHERLDGSGYPQGLHGDQMLLGARILAVADTVEAMGSHRPYRPSRGVDGALLHILQERDKLYDADVVDACLRLFQIDRFQLHSNSDVVEKDLGEDRTNDAS